MRIGLRADANLFQVGRQREDGLFQKIMGATFFNEEGFDLGTQGSIAVARAL